MSRLLPRLEEPVSWIWAASVAALTLCAMAVLLFATPGSYWGWNAPDSLFMAASGHRLVNGQIPHLDFPTPMGVAFYLKMGAAYLLGGGKVAATLEWSALIFGVVAALAVTYVARSRLSLLAAIVVCGALVVVAMAPMAPGGIASRPTFAMMYNRDGWVLITLVALFWLKPRWQGPRWRLLDGAVLGLLTAACIYLKATYGLVALGFWALILLFQRDRLRELLVATGVVIAAALAAEAAFGLGFNLAYLGDLAAANAASESRLGRLLTSPQAGGADFAVCLLLAPALALLCGRLTFRDLVFAACSAGAAILLVWQNAQKRELLLMLAVLVVFMEALRQAGPPQRTVGAAVLAYAAWAVISLTPYAVATLMYAQRSLIYDEAAPEIPALEGVKVLVERDPAVAIRPMLEGRVDATTGLLRLMHQNKPLKSEMGINEYVETLRDGVEAAKACPPGPVLVLDIIDPLSLLADRPPHGGLAWLHLDRSFSTQSHPAFADEFAGVSCVLVPRWPYAYPSTDALLAIYGEELASAYPRVRRTTYWTVRER